MQIYFFTIPIQLVSEQNEELNNLLKSKKIVQIEKHLVTLDGGCYWCICVTSTELTY
jgi:hypothetical protein